MEELRNELKELTAAIKENSELLRQSMELTKTIQADNEKRIQETKNQLNTVLGPIQGLFTQQRS